VKSLGREILGFDGKFPADLGKYRLEARLFSGGGKGATSSRDFEVVSKR
jgi:hypothetical protein